MFLKLFFIIISSECVTNTAPNVVEIPKHFLQFCNTIDIFSCVSIYLKPELINHTTFYWPRLRCWKKLGSGSDRVFKSRAGFLWRDAFCGVLSRMHLNFGAKLHANNTVWIEFYYCFWLQQWAKESTLHVKYSLIAGKTRWWEWEELFRDCGTNYIN